MKITGAMLIGQAEALAGEGLFRAFDPVKGVELEPVFGSSSAAEIDRACLLADAAFDSYRATTQTSRAAFLRAIARGIVALGDVLIERAQAETGLPRARLEGERGRTCGQLEMFAQVVEDGRWMGATVDPALPERKPLPRPDLRLRRIPLGPVAVFGASNFPLAFSVAGGDTASALAAGCPVVVKAHPAHPGTSELVGRVVRQAVAECGLPEGVFSLVTGAADEVGQALVRHPAIQAVGFTGSRAGGLSLMHTVAARPVPIPVYAEMSSINPVLLFPAALDKDAGRLAKGFVDSLVLGVGQFCTNPGLVLGVSGSGIDRFAQAAASELAQRSGGFMLTAGIHRAYERGVAALKTSHAVRTLVEVAGEAGGCYGRPALFSVSATEFLAHPELGREVFGPSALLVVCASHAELRGVMQSLEGQLTATILAEDADAELVREMLPLLERKVGRIVYNGYPTGVEVAWAMVHGGPFPATSDSRTTSVGAGAIDRFLRPVSYQNLPSALLPVELRER